VDEVVRNFVRYFPQVAATMGRDEPLLDDLDIELFVWQNEYSTLVQIDENDVFRSDEDWT